jgi:dipeptidase D
MDMVCVKEDDLDFDFDTQPLPIYVDGDWIRTKGTTLGADNGIAVAMAMAILADKTLEHPALEALFTVEEETGMDGVLALQPEHINGRILINMDSEVEGEVLVSCAGGVRAVLNMPLSWTETTNSESYEIVISGLKGGHSGASIHEGRANSNKLMGRLLHHLQAINGLAVYAINGGEKDNAISKRSVLGLTVPQGANISELVKGFEAVIKAEFHTSDPNITFSVESKPAVSQVLTPEALANAIRVLQLIPFGPQTMSADIPGLVESSSNPGVVVMTEEELVVNNAVRSSVKSLKEEINQRIQALAQLTGGTVELISDYPEWTYAPESKVRDTMVAVYKRMTGKDLRIEAIHAGLECGFLAEKLGDIDMIAIGPDMRDIHTPKEALNISSTGRTFDFVIEVLKELK